MHVRASDGRRLWQGVSPSRIRPGGYPLSVVPVGAFLEQQPHVLDLRQYLAILRRRWYWIVGMVVFTVGATMWVTAEQTPVYEASAEVLVEPLESGALGQSALERALLGSSDLSTQTRLVTSLPIAAAVVEDLALDVEPRSLLDRVDVEQVGDTAILEITASAEDPVLAATLAQGFAEAYLSVRQRDAVEGAIAAVMELRDQADQIRGRIDQLDDEIDDADAEEAAAEDADDTGDGTTDDEGVEGAALRNERDNLLTELGQLNTQIALFQSTERFASRGGEVILPAEVPSDPAAPDPLRNGILALVLGLTLGTGLAFLREQLDDAVRSDTDVERTTGRPVIGHVPHWKEAKKTGRLVTLLAPASPTAEAYRTLRTNVRFLTSATSTRQGRGVSIAVTSAISAEGKTTSVSNLAVAAAQAGQRVILVDSDLRRPTLHEVFGIERRRGFAELLTGDVELRDAVIDVGISNLRIITAGQLPPNPTELLSSPRAQDVLVTMEGVADLVIIDTPPVLAVADALELSTMTTMTLLVVDAGGSSQRALKATAKRLEAINVRVGGIVMNNIESGGTYEGYHHYYSTYTSDAGVVPQSRDATTVEELPGDFVGWSGEDSADTAAPKPQPAPEPQPPLEPEPAPEPVPAPGEATEATPAPEATLAPDRSYTPPAVRPEPTATALDEAPSDPPARAFDTERRPVDEPGGNGHRG